jgi:RnfABCDGE-type electron transport complex B subunit
VTNTLFYAMISMFSLASLIGVMLLIASKRFAVKENPLIQHLEEALPGVNCGACGMASCHAFAERKAADPEADIHCPIGGTAVAKRVAEVLEIELKPTVPMVARLLCQGTLDVSAMAVTYDGIEECRAVALVNAGAKLCPYACIGFGSCVAACPFGAIRKKNGIVEIDEDICTGCGICVKVCPRHVLQLFKKGQKVYVGCSSNDRGGQVRTACAVGCIGCMKCEKTCRFEAIKVSDWKAKVNREKCTQCGECIPVCPVGAIVGVLMEEKLKILGAAKQEEEVRATS